MFQHSVCAIHQICKSALFHRFICSEWPCGSFTCNELNRNLSHPHYVLPFSSSRLSLLQPPSPLPASRGPVKDLVHGSHPVFPQRNYVASSQNGIVHPRVVGQTLPGKFGRKGCRMSKYSLCGSGWTRMQRGKVAMHS